MIAEEERPLYKSAHVENTTSANYKALIEKLGQSHNPLDHLLADGLFHMWSYELFYAAQVKSVIDVANLPYSITWPKKKIS